MPRGIRSFPTRPTSACSLLAAVAAVAMSLGLLTRLATATTFAVVAYNLFLSTTHFHNNRAYLVIVLGLLAVAPCGRELSVDAWIRRRRGRPPLDLSAPAWPLWLLRFECAAIYGSVRPEQARGPRLVRRHRHLAARGAGKGAARGMAAAGLGGLGAHRPGLSHRGGQADRRSRSCSSRPACGGAERGTRAVWVAVVFHVAIEVSAAGQVFSYLAIAVLVIWAVPSTRDRVLRHRPDGPSPAAIRRDWYAHSTGWRAFASSRGPARAGGRRPGRHDASAAHRPSRSR